MEWQPLQPAATLVETIGHRACTRVSACVNVRVERGPANTACGSEAARSDSRRRRLDVAVDNHATQRDSNRRGIRHGVFDSSPGRVKVHAHHAGASHHPWTRRVGRRRPMMRRRLMSPVGGRGLDFHPTVHRMRPFRCVRCDRSCRCRRGVGIVGARQQHGARRHREEQQLHDRGYATRTEGAHEHGGRLIDVYRRANRRMLTMPNHGPIARKGNTHCQPNQATSGGIT